MTRGVLALCLLGLLAVSAGCSALGPGDVNRDRLTREADYGPYWNATADVTIALDKDDYTVIYRIENRTSLAVYRFHRLNNERPLDPIAVRFRYPNGTVVGPAAMGFDKTRSETSIALPARNGTLAMTVPKQGKRIRTPTVLDGSYEVILPPNGRVGIPLLGRVIPRGYQTMREDGRVHLRWEEANGDRIVVRYYLVRDLYLFGGLVAIGIVAAIGGVAYFWLQLRTLKRRREEVAWERGDG